MRDCKPGDSVGIHAGGNMSLSSRVVRNTIYNISGQTIILVVAFFVIPLLIRGMGLERFGILALVWSFIGYFSLFDLGLGRALTTLVARNLKNNPNAIAPLAWTGFGLLVFLGIAGALTIFAIAPWVVQELLKMPVALHVETLTALYLLAATFPFLITQAGFRGILEGLQRFDIVNSVNVILGLFNFGGALLVIQFSTHLALLVAVVIIGRLIGWFVSLIFCFKLIPDLRKYRFPNSEITRKLLSFGGWMSVTNVVGPLMVYLDRFLIGAWLSVTAVAYYTTPYDVVTKLWIIPGALVGALFPVFSAFQSSDPNNIKALFSSAMKYILFLMFPLTLLIIAFAQEGLTFWIDTNFSTHSTTVLQWLSVGVFINSLAYVPFALIQGMGRPDITAKLHLFELPFYLICIFFLISHFGIIGAAIAWTIRVFFDFIFLFFLVKRLLFRNFPLKLSFMFTIIASLIGLLLISFISDTTTKIWVFLLILAAFLTVSYYCLFTEEERFNLLNIFRIRRRHLGNNHEK